MIEKEHLRDLGVTMSNNNALQDHISNISRSCRMKPGWILRTFQTRDRTAMLTLWKTLERLRRKERYVIMYVWRRVTDIVLL